MTTCCHSAFIHAVYFTAHERPTPWGQPRVMSTDKRENRQCIHTSQVFFCLAKAWFLFFA